MADRMKALEAVLVEVCTAAKMQLDGMGKGRPPTQRLQDAFDRATTLLGYDPTVREPTAEEREAERELSELRAAYYAR